MTFGRVAEALPRAIRLVGWPKLVIFFFFSSSASPLAGKRRGPESTSDAESSETAEAPTADSLALVPLTPDDSHAHTLRRSSREHKKPRPYYVAS